MNDWVFSIFELRIQYPYTAWKVSKYGVISGPYFPVFGLNTERYSVSLRIQSEDGKIGTRITPNMDTFHAVEYIYRNGYLCGCWL